MNTHKNSQRATYTLRYLQLMIVHEKCSILVIRKLESVSQFRHKKYFYTILKYKFNFIIVPKGLSRFQINLFHHKIAFLWAFLRGITKLGFHYTTFGLGLGYGGSPLTLKIIFLLSSFHSLLQRFDELKRILAIDVGRL